MTNKQAQKTDTDPRDAAIAELKKQLEALQQKMDGGHTPVAAPTTQQQRKVAKFKEHCLIVLNPKANPDRFIPNESLSLPIEVPGPAKPDGSAPDIQTSAIALIPGIQAIPRAHRDQLFEPRFESVRPFVEETVLQQWSETWDLREMTASKAISTIAQTTKRSKTLLGLWADYYYDYPETVQRRLVQRLEELKMSTLLKQKHAV